MIFEEATLMWIEVDILTEDTSLRELGVGSERKKVKCMVCLSDVVAFYESEDTTGEYMGTLLEFSAGNSMFVYVDYGKIKSIITQGSLQ